MADDTAEGPPDNVSVAPNKDFASGDAQANKSSALDSSFQNDRGGAEQLAFNGAMPGVMAENGDASPTVQSKGVVNGSLEVPPLSPSPPESKPSQKDNLAIMGVDPDDDEDEEDDEDAGDDWMSDEGDESDIEDNLELAFPVRRRDFNFELPHTVTVLDAPHGCKVYLIGTAHFSLESQEDVSKVIKATQPDAVMVELCKNRVNVLELDTETLLEEAKNINLAKIQMAIKRNGLAQGLMQLLFLHAAAHVTKQLGMPPGGEFRRAFQEAKLVPGCRLILGDRPVHITFRRALAALSIWQKLKLFCCLLFIKEPISKEDVEKCKQRDIMEQFLKDLTGDFPAILRVFVQERDIYLAHSLQMAAKPREFSDQPGVHMPTVVVGVVGMGHTPGIVDNWGKELNVRDLMTLPTGSVLGTVFKWTFRTSLLCIVSYGCFRLYRWTSSSLL